MIKKFLAGRGMRKLLRNRMAVGALAIIGCYLLLASAVLFFGLISSEATKARIGPMTTPGAWGSQVPEKRLEDVAFYLDQVESALDAKDPQAALTKLHFAELTIRDYSSVQKLRDSVEAAWAVYDELADSESLDEQPERLPQLVELEAQAAALFTQPEGLAGLTYDLRLMAGTDRQGRSILMRGLYAVKVAVQIGFVSAFLSVIIGTLLGGAAAFFGGWVDALVVWLYSTLSSIPYIVLLMVIAAVFQENAFMKEHFAQSLLPVYAAFCMTFWISPCRVVRGEVLKIKELEYVQAATAVGFGRMHILIRHILPNTVHLMFINFSLIFIGAIKAEVILSFLGLGVKNEPSWGVMIHQATPEVINNFFWQIGTATVLMLVLVLAFNTLSDALQDAFDPKHV